MNLTKDKVVEAGQEAVTSATSWVGGIAESVADSVAGVDVEAAKDETVEKTGAAVAAVAPVAALATKRVAKRSTVLGLALSGAAAYFLDPKKGAERRSKARRFFSSLVARLRGEASTSKEDVTTTNPSFSTPQSNSSGN